jgi:ribosomal protein S27E
MDAGCTHANTGFDPVSRNVICKDCGKVVARVKAKPGKPKIMIKGRIRK